MKNKLAIIMVSAACAGGASANQGLYYIGTEAQTSLPLKWVLGLDAIYDSNVNPGWSSKEDSVALNPYVGASFVSQTPQTTWDVYARVGLITYLKSLDAVGSKDNYTQARVGINLTHRFNERLRLSSRNFLAYELEPDYDYGFATTRQLDDYFYWQSDDSLGYQWTERFATYTGVTLTGLNYSDGNLNDRFTWAVYEQGRYALSPTTVLTLDYRYARTSGKDFVQDYDDQYILAGIEERFSANTIGILKVGANLHKMSGGSNNTCPYVEGTLQSQVNEQFSVRAFTRYGYENYDTVQVYNGGLYQFEERKAWRLGISGTYDINPRFSVFSGADIILADSDEGRFVRGWPGAPSSVGSKTQNLYNVYIGFSVKFNDYLYGTLTYNYTDSSSDFNNQDYNRSRVSAGVRMEF